MPLYTPLDDPSPLPQAYLRSAPPAPAAPALAGECTADCAVIGAGYAGLSTALHLAERGARVVVLEADVVGRGGSGRAFGQVVPYAKNDYSDTLRHYGPQIGPPLVDALAQGPQLVFELVERHGIACDPVRKGLIFAAHSRAGAATLERRAAWWAARGAPVELLDRPAIARLTGTQLYPLAMIERRGGTVMPLAYARGLANAAVRAGVALHEHSRVASIEREGGRWRVRTTSGSVGAASVVVATGAYTDHLVPGLRASIIPLRAHQLVSAPLPEAVRGQILPGGQSLTDTRRLYSGIRLLADGRLHLSVDGPAFDPRGPAFMAKATARLRSLFPQLHDLAWEEAWSGWVDMTVEEYPRIHQPEPGLWVAIGMCGRGIAAATLIGRDLAWHLAGVAGHRMPFPVTPVKPTLASRYAAPLVGPLMTLYRLLDRVDGASFLDSQGAAAPTGPHPGTTPGR